MTPAPAYAMQLDLRVLDHLGIKLYSNAAAVLSEAVANAWDADATLVEMTITADEVDITDNGVGMNRGEINRRFLRVGYDKRSEEGEISDGGRPFMGRKGIGKLALFSLAEIIEVHTIKNGERNALRLAEVDLREAIRQGKTYHPVPIEFDGPPRGTRIALQKLKKQRISSTVSALRKRIARRFSVLSRVGSGGGNFVVKINGDVIGPADREDLKHVEFLWEFDGAEPIDVSGCTILKGRYTLSGAVDAARHPDWLVQGWIGAVSQPKKLKSDEVGSLNGIVVLARGRLIQENILDKMSFSRIMGSYLTGQIQADFLDLEGFDDIATSDRQRVIEDDERYVALTRFMRRMLVGIADQWSDLRNEARGKEALAEEEPLAEWLEGLPDGQKPPAKRLLGLIRGLDLEDEEERTSLYRAGMIAFERLRLREQAHELGNLRALTAERLLPLLSDLAGLEGSLYRDIVRSRLDVIRKFEDLVDADEKERVLQIHLFNNLWLLDPGWERATGSERVEQKLRTEYKEFADDLTDEQSKGRVDIRYRTNAGQHILVELKRAGRRLHFHELAEQGEKYFAALESCLEKMGFRDRHIAIVFVLGQRLHEEGAPGGRGRVEKALDAWNARIVHYESLIRGAREAYSEYLERSREADRLDKLLRRLRNRADNGAE